MREDRTNTHPSWSASPAAAQVARRWAACALGLTALSLGAACSPVVRSAKPANATAFRPHHGGLSTDDQDRLDRNCPAGMPALDPAFPHGPTRLVIRDGYVLRHSSVDRIPKWVCEEVTAAQLDGNAKRRNPFAPDPKLAGFPRAELADYRSSGYDRGHQAPAGDQNRDQRLKDETFYLSNMAPQVPAFNQRAWEALEEEVRRWAREKGTVWVVTGGLFYDPKEDDPATADGLIDYTVIGKDGVAVPTHFYKLVAAKDDHGRWNAIAFALENRAYAPPYRFDEDIRSIDWIEQQTGIDFLPDLDPAEAERLEAQPAAMW